MIRKILFALTLTLVSLTSFSQKGHRIAFIDMNYILENIPDYKKAQNQLNIKVQKWQQDLDQINSEIEIMKTDLSNEKALLTEDLIAEKEEDIAIKEVELKKAEEKYFSSNGNLFLLRKQLVTPIQDQVYNATQEIAKARRYDFVFDKSSDLIMLYSTKQNDISELVLRTIVRGEKVAKSKEKRAARSKTAQRRSATPPVVNAIRDTQESSSEEAIVGETKEENVILSEENSSTEKNNSDEKYEVVEALSVEDAKQAKLDERETKRQEALARSEKIKADRLKKREEQKVAIEKKRLERLKKREEARNQLKQNKENTEDEKNEKEDENQENNN